MAASSFTTVLRARSTAAFLPEEGIHFQFAGLGTEMHVTSRWLNRGLEHPEPGDLWVEVKGPAESVEAAANRYRRFAADVLIFLPCAANMPIGDLRTELVFNSSTDAREREFRQYHRQPESRNLSGARLLKADPMNVVAEAYLQSGPAPRIHRALFQYGLALRNWPIDGEYQCLNHLWIAAESLTKPALSRFCNGRTAKEVAEDLEVDSSKNGAGGTG